MPTAINEGSTAQLEEPAFTQHAATLLPASTGFGARLRQISLSLALLRIARASAAAFVLLTTTFLLLSSFTFSWLNIIRNENVAWVPEIVRNYTWLYWAVLGLNAATLLPAFGRRRSRWCAEAALVVMVIIGLLLTRVYWLYDVPLSFSNLWWSVLLTLPLAALGVHDFAMFTRPERWRRSSAPRLIPLPAAFACGALLGAWCFGIAALRYRDVGAHFGSFLPILAATCLLHACLFASLAAAFSLILQTVGGIKPHFTFAGSLILLWVFASLLLRHLVTPAFSFNNGFADLWSWTYPIGFVVLLAGWHVRRSTALREEISGGAEEILSGLLFEGRMWTAIAALLALLAVFTVPYFFEAVDWDFLFQRLASVGIWIIALCAAWRWFARPAAKPYTWKRTLAWLLAATAGCFLLVGFGRWSRHQGWKAVSRASAAYNGMDASFQVAQLIFHPLVHDSDRTGLFPYLRSNALIGADIHPPALKLVESFVPAAGPRPDIYIVVVDTLRRDYLSPYNPGVSFTPNIAAFAKESFVFRHAYTNYGGTALSEPAIWAGMMIPSKQYVQPFSEMNALEQLIAADGYQRVITPDQILRQVLRPSPNDLLLNVKGTRYFGLDIRDAVREIGQLPSISGPRFVYTQPQNLHPLTLNNLAQSGQRVQGSYPGFYPRYAEELNKVDAAFGQLISNLKAKGKFENSIVILTSDHGDWLGEYGRWGHGQSLLSPIIEVPLLIHLPPALAGNMYSNVEQDVFLTDITPTLYYLLGHRALRKGEFYGRPLFTQTAQEQAGYARPYHFFMSSYSAVFAVLEDSSQTLYVADAVDDNQAIFHLSDDWYGLDNLIEPPSQKKFEALTRGFIGRLNALYGYSPASGKQ